MSKTHRIGLVLALCLAGCAGEKKEPPARQSGDDRSRPPGASTPAASAPAPAPLSDTPPLAAGSDAAETMPAPGEAAAPQEGPPAATARDGTEPPRVQLQPPVDALPLLSSPIPLDPTLPAPSSRTARAPSSAAAPTATAPFWTVRVFYGTNRAASGSADPKEFYDGRKGDVSYGFCDVSIPLTHQRGELESPSIWRFEFREDPRAHVVLLSVRPQSRDRFLSALQRAVWNSMKCGLSERGLLLVGGEVFVFVHGYANTFEDAARRTAQIAYDLNFQGAPVMYSWPSKGKSSYESYKDDGNAVNASEEALIDFVTQIARDSGARRIHLIAHSMGNRVVAEALRRLATERHRGPVPKFNEVILTAPDIDADYFKRSIAPSITQTAERVTIYASSNDRALQASSWVNTLNRPRLGEAGERLTVFPNLDNIDVIDASSVTTALFDFNHSYHAENPTVLNDIELVLAGYPAEQRGLGAILDRLAWRIQSLGERISSGLRNVSGPR